MVVPCEPKLIEMLQSVVELVLRGQDESLVHLIEAFPLTLNLAVASISLWLRTVV